MTQILDDKQERDALLEACRAAALYCISSKRSSLFREKPEYQPSSCCDRCRHRPGRGRWVPDNDHYPERDTQFHILNAAEDLLEACETFLKAYEEASSELHFGQALDSAFADVLEPMYAAIAKARIAHAQAEAVQPVLL